MKKLISLFLAILMLAGFALSAAAAEPAPDAGTAELPVPVAEPASEPPATEKTAEPTASPAPVYNLEAPVVTYSDVPVNTYVEVTVIPAGDGLPEGAVVVYRTNSDWLDYTAPVAVEYNGEFSAKVLFPDNTESAAAVAVISCIDREAPTVPEILADTTTWVNDFIDVSVVSGTDAESGVLRCEYRLSEDGPWTEYTAPVRITEPTVFCARCIDLAGNVSPYALLTISNFDVVAPDLSNVSVAFSCNTKPVLADSGVFGKYYRAPVSVSIDGAVDSLSGIAMYQYQFAGNNESVTDDGWQKYDPAKPPVKNGDFCGYVYVRAIDNAGNVSLPAVSDGIVIDVTAPVISNLSLKPTEITDSRVVATFSVTDNFWLDTVMVNNSYVGTYSPSFNIFRNGTYTITATDKAGNVSTSEFKVTNINSTPFSLLNVFNQLNENSFTPSSWVGAEAAADELQRLLTVSSGSSQLDAASEKLVAAMENLVSRGDGTMSLQLIERVGEYEQEKYTETSWKRIEDAIEAIHVCLDNPESTQADVDSARRNLEIAINELALIGNFTGLDRLIAQCDEIPKGNYDPAKYQVFTDALEAAKALSRTDSSQTDVDAAYAALLTSMESLRIEEAPAAKKMPVVGYVIIGLLVIFILIALFIILKGRKSQNAALLEDEETDGGEPEEPMDEDDGSYEIPYIGYNAPDSGSDEAEDEDDGFDINSLSK